MGKSKQNTRLEADPSDLVARLRTDAATELSNEAASEIERLRELNDKLISASRELYRFSLVIESAVRWQVPGNYEAVMALIRNNNAILSEEKGMASGKDAEADRTPKADV